MTLWNYPVLEAAKMVAASYKPDKNPSFKKLIKKEKKGHARAYLLENDFLIIPGSDSFADYARYNFRIVGIGRKKLRLNTDTAKGFSGTVWHQGFLKHAQEIDEWLAGKRPKVIIGHSLGAATTQILSMSYKVTGIAFAAPRPHKQKNTVINSKYCLCIGRVDDPVFAVPNGFTHVGRSLTLSPKKGRGIVRHKMHRYIEVLQSNTTPQKLPKRWKT